MEQAKKLRLEGLRKRFRRKKVEVNPISLPMPVGVPCCTATELLKACSQGICLCKPCNNSGQSEDSGIQGNAETYDGVPQNPAAP